MTGLVSCPLCGQYEGRPESVRAHISAKRDEAHSGESGFDYDEVLGISDDPETKPGKVKQSFSSDPVDGNDSNPVNDDRYQSYDRDEQTPEPTLVPTVKSVEQDQDEDGNELVRLTLYGAGAYALARFLAGQQDGYRRRDRM